MSLTILMRESITPERLDDRAVLRISGAHRNAAVLIGNVKVTMAKEAFAATEPATSTKAAKHVAKKSAR